MSLKGLRYTHGKGKKSRTEHIWQADTPKFNIKSF